MDNFSELKIMLGNKFNFVISAAIFVTSMFYLWKKLKKRNFKKREIEYNEIDLIDDTNDINESNYNENLNVSEDDEVYTNSVKMNVCNYDITDDNITDNTSVYTSIDNNNTTFEQSFTAELCNVFKEMRLTSPEINSHKTNNNVEEVSRDFLFKNVIEKCNIENNNDDEVNFKIQDKCLTIDNLNKEIIEINNTVNESIKVELYNKAEELDKKSFENTEKINNIKEVEQVANVFNTVEQSVQIIDIKKFLVEDVGNEEESEVRDDIIETNEAVNIIEEKNADESVQFVCVEEIAQVEEVKNAQEYVQTEDINDVENTLQIEQVVSAEELEVTQKLSEVINETLEAVPNEELNNLEKSEVTERINDTIEAAHIAEVSNIEESSHVEESDDKKQVEEAVHIINESANVERVVHAKESEVTEVINETEEAVHVEEVDKVEESDVNNEVESVHVEDMVHAKELEVTEVINEKEESVQVEEVDKVEESDVSNVVEVVYITEESVPVVDKGHAKESEIAEVINETVEAVDIIEESVQVEEVDKVEESDINNEVESVHIEDMVHAKESEVTEVINENEESVQVEEVDKNVESKVTNELEAVHIIKESVYVEESEFTEVINETVEALDIEESVQFVEKNNVEESVKNSELMHILETLQVTEVDNVKESEATKVVKETEEADHVVILNGAKDSDIKESAQVQELNDGPVNIVEAAKGVFKKEAAELSNAIEILPEIANDLNEETEERIPENNSEADINDSEASSVEVSINNDSVIEDEDSLDSLINNIDDYFKQSSSDRSTIIVKDTNVENWQNDQDSLNNIKRDFYDLPETVCSPHPSSESDHAHCVNNLTERVATHSAESILDNLLIVNINQSSSHVTPAISSSSYDESCPELYVEKINFHGKEMDVVYFDESILEECGVISDVRIIRTIPVGIGGRIIGKKGKTKNELLKKFGADLLIYNHPSEYCKQVLQITCNAALKDQLEKWADKTLEQILKNTIQTTVSNPEWLKPMVPLGKIVLVQIVDMPTIQHIKLRLYDPKIIKAYNTMQAEINLDYSNADANALLPSPVAVGCICIAMIRPDYFLRAEIICIYDQYAIVYLYDLGKTHQTCLFYLFKIREKYMKVPFQVMPARMPHAVIKNKLFTSAMIHKRFLCDQNTSRPIVVRAFFPRMNTCCEPCVHLYIPRSSVDQSARSVNTDGDCVDLLELLVSIDVCSMVKETIDCDQQLKINENNFKHFLTEKEKKKITLSSKCPIYFEPCNSRFYEDFLDFQYNNDHNNI